MKLKTLPSTILLGLMVMQHQAQAAEQANVNLPTLEVEGSNLNSASEDTEDYRFKTSRSSTRLNLDTQDTPQSISIVSQQLLDDFSLLTIEDALDLVPGINVERVETDRTYYTSRGFDITNFQIDGLRTPTGATFGNVQGDIDTVIYDRIEVLRGANGLLTGTGNPSATINFVRKRPTDQFKAQVSGLIGSWDQKRATADISGSINESGSVRARAIAAVEDKESYIDRYGKERNVFYGVVDFDLSDDTTLTLGHTYQKDEADSPLWGALQLLYSNGTMTNFDESDSNAADWAYWNNTTNNSFIEVNSDWQNGWESIATFMHIEQESESQLFYTYGALDAETGLGMFAYPSDYKAEISTNLFDVNVTGPIDFAGREHEVVFGAQVAKTDLEQRSIHGDTLGTPLTLDTYLDGSSPKPNFIIPGGSGVLDEEQRTFYGSIKLNISDSLNVIAGTSYLDYEIEGNSYTTTADSDANEWIPYIGAVYSLTKNVNLYASYTETFLPQAETDINRKPLEPIEGKTYEIGVKYAFNDSKALASASIFQTEQDNLAELTGFISGTVDPYYEGQNGVTSKGLELDLQGELTDGLKVSAGYTYVEIEDSDGNRTNTYTPEHTIKLASTYQFQSIPEWTIGGTVKWRDKTYGTLVEQESYATVDAMTSYEISSQLKATLNVYNVFDQEYITSLYWAGLFGQGFNGAPRSAVASLNYTFQ